MNLLKKLREPQGFTLVELIIVIMIIGILAATLLPKVMGAPARARDAARQSDFNAISVALESYFASHNEYPSSASGSTVGQDLVDQGYLKELLQDPKDGSGVAYEYVYCSASVNGVANQAYAVGTRTETSQGGVAVADRHLEVGTAAIITPATADDTKATVKDAGGSGGYAYGASTCVDFDA